MGDKQFLDLNLLKDGLYQLIRSETVDEEIDYAFKGFLIHVVPLKDTKQFLYLRLSYCNPSNKMGVCEIIN